MGKILITTTSSLSNADILQYCGIVTTNVVIGVNFFSDFMASFSDFFGGNSGTYQHKLDGIYKEVVTNLESNAKKKGANAIIGLHIDFDEISGKGKQMFMATAIGTACKVKYLNDIEIKEDIGDIEVSNEAIEQICMSRDILEKLKTDGLNPKQKTWEFIFTHNMPELATPLVEHFFTIQGVYQEEYMQNLQQYLSTLDYNHAIETLYPFLEKYSGVILPIIKKQMLFDPQKVLSYIENGNLQLAIELLSTSKEHYNIEDLKLMEEIIDRFDNLPDKGKIETQVVSGLFSKKEEEVYICPNGHQNDKDAIYCSKVECRLNIKGLTPVDVKRIENFKTRVSVLKDIMNKMNE